MFIQRISNYYRYKSNNGNAQRTPLDIVIEFIEAITQSKNEPQRLLTPIQWYRASHWDRVEKTYQRHIDDLKQTLGPSFSNNMPAINSATQECWDKEPESFKAEMETARMASDTSKPKARNASQEAPPEQTPEQYQLYVFYLFGSASL